MLKQAPEALIYSQKNKYDKVCLLDCNSLSRILVIFSSGNKRISVAISIFNVLKYIFEMPAFRMNLPCVDKFHFLGSVCHM